MAITSDQSLNNYEAYRRGDHFYVKIPAADVSRAESARGRGFADVKSQRSGDSTVLSFRLEPGASAHVEQHGNKLDVVVSIPGGSPASGAVDRPRDLARSGTSESSRTGDLNKRGNAKRDNSSPGDYNNSGAPPDSRFARSASGNANESGQRSSPNSSLVSSNSASSSLTTPANGTSEPASQSQASSGTQTTSPAAVPQSSPLTNISASPSATIGTAREDFWTRTKGRGHYWLLLAQLNPVPVALGAMLLVFIIMLLFLRRRRARSTRQIKRVTSTAMTAAAGTALSKRSETAIHAETATVIADRPSVGKESLPVMRAVQRAATERAAPAAPTVVSRSEDSRRQPLSQAYEEARKVLAGDQYDQRVIGSEGPETRRLVGAELLSALVSRNTARRERARAAFMKHGYFDDATHDLRTAGSENERAAAARRLSFVNDREATPHLVAALNDPSPDVRRAAVEALMDIRDPAATAALNTLLQNEKDRKVPQNLIQKAIEACGASPETVVMPEPGKSPGNLPEPPASINADREVIEI